MLLIGLFVCLFVTTLKMDYQNDPNDPNDPNEQKNLMTGSFTDNFTITEKAPIYIKVEIPAPYLLTMG